jgi:hypothetical protein
MFKVKMKAVVVLVVVAAAAATVAGQVREEEQEAVLSKTEPKNIDGKSNSVGQIWGSAREADWCRVGGIIKKTCLASHCALSQSYVLPCDEVKNQLTMRGLFFVKV